MGTTATPSSKAARDSTQGKGQRRGCVSDHASASMMFQRSSAVAFGVCVLVFLTGPHPVSAAPTEGLLPFEYCVGAGGTCTCDGTARWGFPLDNATHPEGTHWVSFLPSSETPHQGSLGLSPLPALPSPRSKLTCFPSRSQQTYARVDCMTFKCEAQSWRVDPTPPAGAVGAGICECSSRIEPPPPKEEDLDFKWCSEKGEPCDCDGVMRYGHTGLAEHYLNNSRFFHEHPDLVRHVAVDVSAAPGLFPCDMSSYGWEKTAPWAEHPEMADKMNCQCASVPRKLCNLSPPSPEAPTSPPPIPEPPLQMQPPTAPGRPPPPHPFPPPNPEPPTFPPVPAEVSDLVFVDPVLLDEPGDAPDLPETRTTTALEADAKLSESMEEISIDNLPGVKPWLVQWDRCADAGGDCECPGTIRYGHAGMKEHYENDGAYFKENPHVVRWMMRLGDPDVPTQCTRAKFGDRDPFPDIPDSEKFCLCAPLVKPYQFKISGVTWGTSYDSFGAFFEVKHDGDKYRDCAAKGEFCECDGTVRIGQPSHAVPADAYRSFWKEIFMQHDDLHKVQGRWFLRAADASTGGVQCDTNSFLKEYNTKRLTEGTADDAVRCQCLPGSDDDHADFYPQGTVDEMQLITLDSVAVPSEEAKLASAYLADDQRIAVAIAGGETESFPALGAAPSLGKAPKVAHHGVAKTHHVAHGKVAHDGKADHGKAEHNGVEHGKVEHGKASEVSEKHAHTKSSAHTLKAKPGAVEGVETQTGTKHATLVEDVSLVGLKKSQPNDATTTWRFRFGLSHTKMAAATAVLGVAAAMGVAAARLSRSKRNAAGAEKQPLLSQHA